MLSYSVECLHFLHGITGRVWWRRRRKEDHEFEASLGSTELWSLGSDFSWGCCLWTTGESETLSEGCLGAKGEWEKTKDSPETTWVSWLPSPLGADLYLQQKVLNFNEIQFVCIFLLSYLRNHDLIQGLKDLYLCFLLSFVVLAATYR